MLHMEPDGWMLHCSTVTPIHSIRLSQLWNQRGESLVNSNHGCGVVGAADRFMRNTDLFFVSSYADRDRATKLNRRAPPVSAKRRKWPKMKPRTRANTPTKNPPCWPVVKTVNSVWTRKCTCSTKKWKTFNSNAKPSQRGTSTSMSQTSHRIN